MLTLYVRDKMARKESIECLGPLSEIANQNSKDTDLINLLSNELCATIVQWFAIVNGSPGLIDETKKQQLR